MALTKFVNFGLGKSFLSEDISILLQTILTYHKLDIQEQTSVKFPLEWKIYFMKIYLKMLSAKFCPVISGHNVLRGWSHFTWMFSLAEQLTRVSRWKQLPKEFPLLANEINLTGEWSYFRRLQFSLFDEIAAVNNFTRCEQFNMCNKLS